MALIEPKDRATILIHFYRAMVGRADIWRVRMDTTTNWAIGATAAVVSFALGSSGLPHFVLLMAPLLTACFLMLEARRLTFYHLWQGRVLRMERGLIRPALLAAVEAAPGDDPSSLADAGGVSERAVGDAGEDLAAHLAEDEEELVRALDPELGRTVPSMPISKAVARRLRRIYVYLFAAQWLAWILKLSSHPTQAESVREVMLRAGAGAVPGAVVIGFSVVVLGGAAVFAFARGGVDRRAMNVDTGS